MVDALIGIKNLQAQEKLAGKNVTLALMKLEHAKGLFQAANNQKIWQALSHKSFTSITEVEKWIEVALATTNTLPFSIFNAENIIIGSTRYLDITKQFSIRNRLDLAKPELLGN